MNSDTGEMRRYLESEKEQAKKDGFDIELTESEYVQLAKETESDRLKRLAEMRDKDLKYIEKKLAKMGQSPWGKKFFTKKDEEIEEDKTGNRPSMQVIHGLNDK